MNFFKVFADISLAYKTRQAFPFLTDSSTRSLPASSRPAFLQRPSILPNFTEQSVFSLTLTTLHFRFDGVVDIVWNFALKRTFYSLCLTRFAKAVYIFANICSPARFFACKIEGYYSFGRSDHADKLRFRLAFIAADTFTLGDLLFGFVLVMQSKINSILTDRNAV